MKKSWFEFHWKDGTTTYGKGENVAEAACIGYGGLAALDYWDKAKEIPDEMKELYYIPKDGTAHILHPETMFAKQASEQIRKGLYTLTITIGNNVWNVKCKKTDFQYVLTEV